MARERTPDNEGSARRTDAGRLAAYRAFITAHAAIIAQLEREMAAAGVIPLTWYDVLLELYEASERRLRLHELARRVVLSRSGLTRTVDRLAAAGLLRRESDPLDRRGAFAILTTEGHAALRQAWPIYARGIAAYFTRHLDEEEARALTAIFERIRAAAQES